MFGKKLHASVMLKERYTRTIRNKHKHITVKPTPKRPTKHHHNSKLVKGLTQDSFDLRTNSRLNQFSLRSNRIIDHLNHQRRRAYLVFSYESNFLVSQRTYTRPYLVNFLLRRTRERCKTVGVKIFLKKKKKRRFLNVSTNLIRALNQVLEVNPVNT